MEEKKEWYKSSTVRTAIALGVLGIVEANFHMLEPILKDYQGLTYIGLSVVMMLLRIKTTQGITI